MRTLRTRLAGILCVAVLASASPSGAAAAKPRTAPPVRAAKNPFDALFEDAALAGALWSVEARSLKSGRVVYARNAEASVQPASVLKVVTTAAALDAYGAAATFATTVETAARVDAFGRVLGDVYLVGGGDPNLSGRFADGRPTAVFETMAGQLAAAGVRRIDGRLLGVDVFRGPRRGTDWSWEDLVWWYGAEVTALAFNDNAAHLSIGPGEKAGDPARVTRDPDSRFYSVETTATTAPAGAVSTLRVEKDAGGNVVRVSGLVPAGSASSELDVAIEDPALYATTVFAEVLARRGIEVAGGPAVSTVPLPEPRRVLARQESAPLSELVKVVNKNSQNLHAEMLLRLVGMKAAGEGSTEAGLSGVRAFLQKSGVALDRWDLADGCGLSGSNLVTADGLVQLLLAMDGHPAANAFRDSLPIAGQDGSLRNRLRGTAAEAHVIAKTGTLRHVNALAGYATTRSGERIAFAAIVNNHKNPGAAVDALDAFARRLAELK